VAHAYYPFGTVVVVVVVGGTVVVVVVVGGGEAACGVALTEFEAGEVPFALDATTVKVYRTPLASPVTVHDPSEPPTAHVPTTLPAASVAVTV